MTTTTTQSRTLTADTLRKNLACKEQIDLFNATFGESVEVTVELCVQHAGDFNWNWAAGLLSIPAGDAYDAAIKLARDAYDAAIKLARDAYYAAIKPARDAYDAAIKPAGDAYDAAIKLARDAYDAAIKPAGDAYDAAHAVAFANAYIADGKVRP